MGINMKDAVDAMEYDELMRIKMELDSGAFNMKKMVIHKIKEKEKLHERRCAVCSNEIDPYSTNNYTLMFGPEDFKKKATFCALDCLEYFTSHLRDMKGYRKAPTASLRNKEEQG